MIFKLLNALTAWYNKKMMDAYQKSLNNTYLLPNEPDLRFRNTLYILSNDKKIPAEQRKVLSEYLWRTRKQLIAESNP